MSLRSWRAASRLCRIPSAHFFEPLITGPQGRTIDPDETAFYRPLMQILSLLFAIIVGISVWWWRLKMLKQASDTVIDAAERFGGSRRRKKIAENTAFSPITAIEEPVTAAATFIHLVVGDEVWPMAHGRLKARLAEVSSPEQADEAVRYAEWAYHQGLDETRALGFLTETLREHLTLDEREDLADMLKDAASSGDGRLQAKASREAIALVN